MMTKNTLSIDLASAKVPRVSTWPRKELRASYRNHSRKYSNAANVTDARLIFRLMEAVKRQRRWK